MNVITLFSYSCIKCTSAHYGNMSADIIHYYTLVYIDSMTARVTCKALENCILTVWMYRLVQLVFPSVLRTYTSPPYHCLCGSTGTSRDIPLPADITSSAASAVERQRGDIMTACFTPCIVCYLLALTHCIITDLASFKFALSYRTVSRMRKQRFTVRECI